MNFYAADESEPPASAGGSLGVMTFDVSDEPTRGGKGVVKGLASVPTSARTSKASQDGRAGAGTVRAGAGAGELKGGESTAGLSFFPLGTSFPLVSD